LSLLKKCSLSKHIGPNHSLHRLESLCYRPGAKALAVETRVVAHYRGQVRGIARTGSIYDPISTKKMLSEPTSHGKTGFWRHPEGSKGTQFAEKARFFSAFRMTILI